MRLVVGIIRPERLEAVKEALGEAKVFRLTVSDVQGISADAGDPAEGGAAAAYRAGGSVPSATPGAAHPAAVPASAVHPSRRVKLEIAVNESFVEPTVRAIVRAARLDGGRPGDGKVLVLPLDECVRIRTGERGPEAI